MKFLKIKVPQGDDKKKKESLFRELLDLVYNSIKKSSISFEILGDSQYTYFFVAVPDFYYELIENLFYSLYPDCEIIESTDYVDSFDQTSQYIKGAVLKYKYDDIYPIRTFDDFEEDSQSRLFSVISKLLNDDNIWIQFVVKPLNETAFYHIKRKFYFKWSNFKRFFSVNDRIRIKGKDSIVYKRKGLAMNKINKKPFQVTIRVAYVSKNKLEIDNRFLTVSNIFNQFDRFGVQSFKILKKNSVAFLRDYKKRKLEFSNYLIADEISTLYHLPNPDFVPNIVHVLAKKSEAPQDLPKGGDKNVSSFGLTNYHNNFTEFGINRPDRRRHLYVVGKSGSGKSKLLELLIKADIEDGHGVCVLDPHGDLVDNVVKFIPKARINDVIYFDPSDTDFPIAFNPLENVGEEYKMQVTLGFIQIFKKLFGTNWSDRLEHVLRYTVLALLDTKGTTILSIMKILTDKNYRQEIILNIKDSVVKNFWVSEFAGWSERFDSEAITPLLNKVGQFVSTNMIRNIVGQPKNKFDIREVMDNKKILLMKVSKGLLGEENSSLLGAMIVTKIYQAAMSRADILEEKRNDFYLYVDEFQNFATDSFSEILSEARKYRLNLTIAHQYMGQLSDVIKKTVFGNVGSMINFRVGAEDAALLAEEYNPVFKKRDILNLGVREFYCKMSVNGEIRKAFSGRTLAVPNTDGRFVSDIIDNSRKNYCIKREDIENVLEGKIRKHDDMEDFLTQSKFQVPIL